MPKPILETKAAAQLGAHLILDRKGNAVARVLSYYAPTGGVTVEVHNYGDVPDAERRQSGHAGGYGYDKFTAALAGLTVAGHIMTNHCERLGAPKPPRGKPGYPSDRKPPKGYSYANPRRWFRSAPGAAWKPSDTHWYRHDEDYAAQVDAAEERGDVFSGFADCYRRHGLTYLSDLGFRVHEVI